MQRRRRRRRFSGGGQGDVRALIEPVQDGSSVLGSRTLRREECEELKGPPSAFGLFCTHYLGVTPDDGYRKPSLDETARRYGMPHDEVVKLLREHQLDPATLSKNDFDLEGARLDIRVAPEGISRIALARDLFESYCESIGASAE